MRDRMVGGARGIYVIGAWLFLLGVLLQFFLAGMALFSTSTYWDTHIGVGYTVGYLIPILLLVGWLGKIPRSLWRLFGLMVLLYIIQTLLPNFKDVAPWIAALHPLNAIGVATVSTRHAMSAQALIRVPQTAKDTPREPAG